jgi:hypothetical protein
MSMSMSAHRCCTAWKDPMGVFHCSRVFTRATVWSRAALAAPTASAHSTISDRAIALSIASVASSTVLIAASRSTRTASNVIAHCSSRASVSSGAMVMPRAAGSATNTRSASSLRATTSNVVALAAKGTKHFVPVSTHESPSVDAALVAIESSRALPSVSVMQHAYRCSPRCKASRCCVAPRAWRTNPLSTTPLKNGDGSAARPISSATTTRSVSVSVAIMIFGEGLGRPRAARSSRCQPS